MSQTNLARMILLLATTGVAMTAMAAKPVHYREVPDDPPGAQAARADFLARSPGKRVTVGGYVSVQVNVDPGGLNIIGDAANEPSIAIDPNNPDSIVIGWRQFDTISSNFRQAGWSYSQDGGQTWTFPGVLTPGIFRSDPVLDTDSNGNFHYQSLQETFLMDLFSSSDGGVTWGAPVFSFGGDKNWMSIDKSGGMGDGHIYGIWQRFFGCCGQNTLVRSIDGGASFQPPVAVEKRPVFGTMTVGPDGELYAAGVDGTVTQDLTQFVVAKSLDAQNPSLSPTTTGVDVALGGTMEISVGPNPAGLLGQANIAVDHSDGPRRGHAYLLASVDPPGGSDPLDVHLSRSTDGGQTWSAPIRVNNDAPGNWQWFGVHSVGADGRLDVVWNDTRESGQSNISRLYYAWSYDGGDSWYGNQPVSPAWDSFIGWPNQNKIGDYYTLISDETGAGLAWSATFNGEQDVYYTRLFPDCNSNGISDVSDIGSGASDDDDGNQVPDECQFDFSGPTPGLAGQSNSFSVTGATPGANVLFLRSANAGSTPVPGCSGLTVGLASPSAFGQVAANGSGTATVARQIPAGASGLTFLFEGVELSTCRATGPVTFTFP